MMPKDYLDQIIQDRRHQPLEKLTFEP